MEAKQSSLTSFYTACKKNSNIKSIGNNSASKIDVAKKLIKETELTIVKSKNISRSKKYNSTKTSIVELLDICNKQNTKLESPKSKNQLTPVTPPCSNKTQVNHQITSVSKRKHSETLTDQNIRTPETNVEVKDTKVVTSARKRLPLFDEKDNETEPNDLAEEETKDIEFSNEDFGDNNFWTIEFPLVSNIPRPVSPLPETPQKLRKLREERMAVNNQASQSGSNDSKELLKETDPVKTPLNKLSSLTSEKIKANLMKCNKLEELKKQMLLIKELKAATKIKEKHGIAPSSKTEVEKEKSETVNKIPAYKRFQHLILPIPSTLTLPYSYTVLEDFFQRVDDIVRILHNRLEVCTFTKLKSAVEKITKRDFKERILGQMKAVYPTAFEFKQERGLPRSGYKWQGYQLTITPQLKESGMGFKDPDSGKLLFTASDLITRKRMFHSYLVKNIMKIHKEFLQNLPKPMSISDEKLTRWHPKFQLDQVPDIEPSFLPQPPYVKVYQTASDVLNATKGSLHPKVESALLNVSKTSHSTNQTSTPTKAESPSTQGIPSRLLERIRAKEAKRLEETITQTPQKAQRQTMLNRLPHIYRIMRAYFVTEKKTALLLDILVEKISESYKTSISKADVEKHLELLLEVAPSWVSVATTQNGKYVKLNRTLKLQDIQEKINLCCKKLTQ